MSAFVYPMIRIHGRNSRFTLSPLAQRSDDDCVELASVGRSRSSRSAIIALIVSTCWQIMFARNA